MTLVVQPAHPCSVPLVHLFPLNLPLLTLPAHLPPNLSLELSRDLSMQSPLLILPLVIPFRMLMPSLLPRSTRRCNTSWLVQLFLSAHTLERTRFSLVPSRG